MHSSAATLSEAKGSVRTRGEPDMIGSPIGSPHMTEWWLHCALRAQPRTKASGATYCEAQARSVSFLTVSFSIKSGLIR